MMAAVAFAFGLEEVSNGFSGELVYRCSYASDMITAGFETAIVHAQAEIPWCFEGLWVGPNP
jgi:hypothetical protein